MKVKQKALPVILLIMAIPIAAFGIFLLVANLLIHDEPFPDDASLSLPNVIVADADNAFLEMQKIGQSQSFPLDPDNKLAVAIDAPVWDDTFVTMQVTQHAADIAIFRKAAKLPAYQDPNYARPSAINNPYSFPILTSYRQAAQVVALDAEQKARNGEVGDALDEAVDVVRFGHLMESGRGVLIEYLIGSSIKQTGLTALRQIALTANVTADQAKNIAAKLEPFRDSKQGQINALKMEYQLSRSQWSVYGKRIGTILPAYSITADENGVVEQPSYVIYNIIDYSGLGKYYYFPNQTLRFMSDLSREQVKNAVVDCPVANHDSARILPVTNPGFSWIFTPNIIGKVFTSENEISMGGFVTKRCDESVAVSATQTLLAINTYIANNKNAPASLSELIPKYLTAMPIDPFSGNSLLYSAEKKIVYSVGPDRQDLGGSVVSTDWQKLDNPSFQVSQ